MKIKTYILLIILISFIFSSFGVLLEYYYLKSQTMAESVWGQLAKSQTDNETVEEAIARLINEHGTDAGAHTGAGGSLETHKTQSVVDHPAGSIVEDKLDDGAVTTPKIENFAVTNAKIDDLAVTNAKINDLCADKITAGAITSQAITLAISAGEGDVKIQAGKTDFGDDTAGFILGIDDSDDDTAKFEIGNSTDYFKWDGTNVKMLCSAENAIHVQHGSDILLSEGGDIKFTPVENGCGLEITLWLIETSGNVNVGEHRYQVTFVNEAGETALTQGWYSGVTTDATHKQVDLTNIPVSSSGSVTKRRIYRTKANDNYNYYLLTTIDDNTTTTYTDNIADSNLTGGEASNKENNSFGKMFINGFVALNLGSSNTFVGQGVGYENATGYKNVAVGGGAMENNTIGYANVAIGDQALKSNLTGKNNVAIGGGDTWGALSYNTTGDNNVAIGYEALLESTSLSNNVAIGYKALRLTNYGDGNIAIGAFAGAYASGEDMFFINNRDRIDEEGDWSKSLMVGFMETNPEDQWLKINGLFSQSNQNNITAHAGGGSGSAVDITGNIAEVGVCDSAGDSIKLPGKGYGRICDEGVQIIITNRGAASCDVFPSSSGKINGSENAKPLAVNASMLCIHVSDYDWECSTLAR